MQRLTAARFAGGDVAAPRIRAERFVPVVRRSALLATGLAVVSFGREASGTRSAAARGRLQTVARGSARRAFFATHQDILTRQIWRKRRLPRYGRRLTDRSSLLR